MILKDMESHQINLAYIPNKHMLACGKAGVGKSYLLTAFVEDIKSNSLTCAIVDISWSYAEIELKRHKFKANDDIVTFDIRSESDMEYSIRCKDLSTTFASAIIYALNLDSYNQKSVVKEMCFNLERCKKRFSLGSFWKELVDYNNAIEMGYVEVSTERAQNVKRLLSKCEIFDGLFSISFTASSEIDMKPITLFQLSELPQYSRNAISEFLLFLLWDEARQSDLQSKYDFLILDEFQSLRMDNRSVLYQILREGRKFSFNVFLATQYVSQYRRDQLSVLTQVATVFLFQQTDKERDSVCRLFSLEKSTWEKRMLRLKIGEAILIGHYRLAGKKRILDRPLIVRVWKSDL